jgi:hypothetical protein
MAKLRITTTVVVVRELEEYQYQDLAEVGKMDAAQAKLFLEREDFDQKMDDLQEIMPYISFPNYNDGFNHRRTAGSGTFTEVIEAI